MEKEYFAVGRVTLNEERSVGEIVSSNRLCFALNGGNYYWTKYYDVLTVKPNRKFLIFVESGINSVSTFL